MCNLSQSIWDRGVATGVDKGTAETNRRLVLAMLQNHEPLEKIKMYTGFSDAEIAVLAKAQ